MVRCAKRALRGGENRYVFHASYDGAFSAMTIGANKNLACDDMEAHAKYSGFVNTRVCLGGLRDVIDLKGLGP